MLGNALGSVKIVQEGDGDISLPKLGKTGKQLVASMAMDIAQSFSKLFGFLLFKHHNSSIGFIKIAPNAIDRATTRINVLAN